MLLYLIYTLIPHERDVNALELFKDVAVLILLIVLLRKRVSIGHALFVCALLFGILHRLPLTDISGQLYRSLISPSTLTLLGALYLITLLEQVMRHTNIRNQLVTGLRNVSGDPRFSLAALPSIIGLLPSPGGARFSAPMVDDAAKNMDLSGDRKAAINYYYRHTWEYFLPLYPSSLLAAEILNIPLGYFMLVMLPYSLVTIAAGLLLFRHTTPPPKDHEINRSQAFKEVLKGLTPIIAITLLVMVFHLDILIALLLVIAATLIIYRVPWENILAMLKDSLEPRMLYTVYSAVFLRDILTYSGRIDQLVQYANSIGLSPLIIALTLPALIGMLSGMIIPGVAITLPIMVALSGSSNVMVLGGLAFITNYIGDMFSPLHLCLIMSTEHFNADLGKTYRWLVAPYTLVFAFALVYTYVLYLI